MSGRPDAAPVEVERLGDLAEPQTAEILRLAAEAARVDGAAALSEQTLLRLRRPDHDGAVVHLLTRTDDGQLAGYAQRDPQGATELVVAPHTRGRGHGRALARAAMGAPGADGVRLWSHGNHPAAAALATDLGLRPVRELHRMIAEPPRTPDASLPAGVRVRGFVPGRDEQAWLACNRVAFADHPEQGRISADDLAERMDEPWFDPAGFFLAERGEGPATALVGFHWTKVHPGHEPPLGEIYVLGVDPGEQGTGLGTALAVIGLRHLRDVGARAVILYVEAANAAAITVYDRLGFDVDERHVVYAPA